MDLVFRKLAFVEPAGSEELWHCLWEREAIEAYLESPGREPASGPPVLSLCSTSVELARMEPRGWEIQVFQDTGNRPLKLRRNSRRSIAKSARPSTASISIPISSPDAIAFLPLFWLLLAYNLCYQPSVTLANSICFRNLPNPERQFGQARVFGTLGWIAASFSWDGPFRRFPRRRSLLRPSSLCSWRRCASRFHIRRRSLSRRRSHNGSGGPHLRSGRSVLCVFSAVGIPIQRFHGVPQCLHQPVSRGSADRTSGRRAGHRPSHRDRRYPAHPAFAGRLGFRWLLTIGLLCSALRFVGYATCSVPWVIGLGLAMHGLGFSFFYITAAIYVDLRPGDMRASSRPRDASDLGNRRLAGTILSGIAVDRFSESALVDWRSVWLIPAIGTFVLALVFAVVFRDPPATAKMTPSCSA